MGHLLLSVAFSQAMNRYAVLCQRGLGQENIQTESETVILANNYVIVQKAVLGKNIVSIQKLHAILCII